MKKFFSILIFGVLAVSTTKSQPQITVNGGNQTLSITTGVPGGQPASVINASATLSYKKQLVLAKISIGTVCPGQRFTLKVLATSVTKGVAAPEVTLTNGMLATNLITDIGTTGGNGTCTLQYTASSTFAQGNSAELGNDVHTITYTILAQ